MKQRFITIMIQELLRCYLRAPLDSILEAVFTVSPNRQYLGIVNPTIPEYFEYDYL